MWKISGEEKMKYRIFPKWSGDSYKYDVQIEVTYLFFFKKWEKLEDYFKSEEAALEYIDKIINMKVINK